MKKPDESYNVIKCCKNCKNFQEYCNLYPEFPSQGKCLKINNIMLWFNECKEFESK